MTATLCTLYNSLYLDKGLVLYDSLRDCAKDFKLYVLCMDDKCYEVLKSLDYPEIIPIKLEEFEGDELLSIKSERKLGEYFWTCSSWLIGYVLEHYQECKCTYIDADMYFYQNPVVLLKEMDKHSASVMVVGHRFYPMLQKEKTRLVGKYCVEFNAFKNEPNSLSLLNLWKSQVIKRCSLDGDGIHWGDQKYLDSWVDDFDFVIETINMGAGIAPWNISQYKLKELSQIDNNIVVKKGRNNYNVVFYHFENIQYIDNHTVRANLECYWGIDRKLIETLYIPYLQRLSAKKQMLKEKYGIDCMIKKHPGVSKENKRESAILALWCYMKLLFDIAKRNKDYFYPMKYLAMCRLPKSIYKNYSIIRF